HHHAVAEEFAGHFSVVDHAHLTHPAGAIACEEGIVSRSPPPCGEGRGWGGRGCTPTARFPSLLPPTPPPPTRGEGACAPCSPHPLLAICSSPRLTPADRH